MLVYAGGIEMYSSSFSNIAVGKDYPLLTFTSGMSGFLKIMHGMVVATSKRQRSTFLNLQY